MVDVRACVRLFLARAAGAMVDDGGATTRGRGAIPSIRGNERPHNGLRGRIRPRVRRPSVRPCSAFRRRYNTSPPGRPIRKTKNKRVQISSFGGGCGVRRRELGDRGGDGEREGGREGKTPSAF